MVNGLIEEKRIKKEYIIEYRTENWVAEKNGEDFWNYKVIISWWS